MHPRRVSPSSVSRSFRMSHVSSETVCSGLRGWAFFPAPSTLFQVSILRPCAPCTRTSKCAHMGGGRPRQDVPRLLGHRLFRARGWAFLSADTTQPRRRSLTRAGMRTPKPEPRKQSAAAPGSGSPVQINRPSTSVFNAEPKLIQIERGLVRS